MDRHQSFLFSRMKRTSHNVFGFSSILCSLLYAAGIALCILFLLDVVTHSLALVYRVLIAVVILLVRCNSIGLPCFSSITCGDVSNLVY